MRPAEVDSRCRLTGGRRYSYYDDSCVDGARGLDIDHLVPLAEGWDSGASDWDAKRREVYANGLDADASLIAVAARCNQSKGAARTPPRGGRRAPRTAAPTPAPGCRPEYHYGLKVDSAEKSALSCVLNGCS